MGYNLAAYQIKLTLKGTKPVVWRSVVIPKDLTFQDLHKVIQTVLNFQDRQLFQFEIPDEDLKVTNDQEAYLVHQEFQREREAMEATLKALNTPFAQAQLAKLQTVVKKPTELRVDSYLERYQNLEYHYDLTSEWYLEITLEKQVVDVTITQPVLKGGAETAPPEDLGEMEKFYEFLIAYQDPEHEDHQGARLWAKEQNFSEYDPQQIETRLQALKFETEGRKK